MSKSIVVDSKSEIETKYKLTNSDNERIRSYLTQDTAASTQRAYIRHWNYFEAYCLEKECQSIGCDADVLAAFLTEMADNDFSYSSIGQARAAIHKAHTFWNVRRKDPVEDPTEHPLIRTVMKGIKRKIGDTPRKKMALSIEQIKSILDTFGSDARGLRDKSMISIGILTGMRRSEICTLTMDMIEFAERGMTITLGKAKADEGAILPVPRLEEQDICPVSLTERWLDISGIKDGPVFRGIHPQSGELLNECMTDGWFVKRLKEGADLAGINITKVGGHSLRAGFVTSAVESGAAILDIAEMTRHRSLDVLKGYYRKQDMWKNPVSANIGMGKVAK